MKIAFRRISAFAFSVMIATPPVSADQTDSAVFDLTLRGIHAGTLSISGAIDGTSYSASGVLKSGGLVALVRKVRYDARASGTVKDGRFTPSRYEEDADTGKRQSQSVMDYKNGTPQIKTYNPPRPARDGDIDPATQGGTVDPLTALYAVLRDVPEAEACTLKAFMFDGQRRSQVVLSTPEKSGDSVTCLGEYRRLDGFSAKEMAEKQQFAFRMTYLLADNGMMRADEIIMDSLYGKGRLKRR